MSNWTLAKYVKMCRDCHSDADSEYGDSLEDDILWYDMAQCMLDNEDGLEEFIQDRIGAQDVLGCLADDLAYPNTCKNYTLKPAKKKKG